MTVTAVSLVPALRGRLGTLRPSESLQFETDAEVDDFLENMLSRSISHVEEFLARDIIGSAGSSATRVFDGRGADFVSVDDLTSATAVNVDQVDDGTFDLSLTVASDILELPTNDTIKTALKLRRNAPLRCFPRAEGAIQVTATFGWPSLPGGVEDVILRLTENAYLVAMQNRTGPVVQVGDFEVQMRDERVFTPALRGDLAPWRRHAV